jgi:LCP family protein required for cell wall assembly
VPWVLLVGADERPRYDDVGRSDTMILLFINPRTDKAAMLSIPRDLRVRIPDHGTNKINASFALGGVELVRRTIESEFEVDIDYYAKVDFGGFVDIVDMLGGVEIDVPDIEGRGRGMNYDDNADDLHIHLKPGRQVLDGENAIGFVRYRKGDSDFARSERQHQFLKAMAEQKLKLRNAIKLTKVAKRALEAIETDMSWRDAVDAGRAVRQIRSDCLLSISLQPYLRDRKIGGLYYVVVSDSSVNRVLSEIDDHLESMPGQVTVVDVLNGSGESGAAATVGQRLLDADFDLRDTGNAEAFDHERTLIHYPDDGLSAARRIQRVLGVGELVELDEESEFNPDRITIVVGSDVDIDRLQRNSG